MLKIQWGIEPPNIFLGSMVHLPPAIYKMYKLSRVSCLKLINYISVV